MPFYAGLSGLQLPMRKRDFPPEFLHVSRLTFYASIFNSIEINSSFYKLPQERTLERWLNETPSEFRFTFKVWKEITHVKGLEFDPANVLKFTDIIRIANPKAAALLIQLPPSCGIENRLQLDKLLESLNSFTSLFPWKIAVEFRNPSWYAESVYDLLSFHHAAIVIHDMRKSATPLIHSAVDFKYVRFHGPEGNYRGTYTEDFLSEYASYFREWQDEEKTVFAYFNNTMGNAYANCNDLNAMVKGIV